VDSNGRTVRQIKDDHQVMRWRIGEPKGEPKLSVM
jgi:hypothetical protein